jgi:hypothetical protein
MSKKHDRFVVLRPDGTWANQRVGSDPAASVRSTQRGAKQAAENLRGSGGGELNIRGRDGQIRQWDTTRSRRRGEP